MLLRRRAGSPDQPIWEVFKDVRRANVYRVEALGVRVRDCNSDGRFAGGLVELRRKGELAQALGFANQRPGRIAALRAADAAPKDGTMPGEWVALDAYFDARVAAVRFPDDSSLSSVQADWVLVGSSPRLEALVRDGSLRLIYTGESRVRLRDLLLMRDVRRRGAGVRVVLFFLREVARDLFSVRHKSGLRDWLRFATAVLGALSGLGSLSWLISRLLTALS